MFIPNVIAFTLTTLAVGNTIVERFDENLNGWTVGPGTDVEYSPDGGNHGGMMVVIDAGTPDMTAIAPPAFLGDLSAFAGGRMSFDAMLVDAATPDMCLGTFGQVTIEGPAGSATKDLALACLEVGCWNRFDARLSADAWGLPPATWTALLANVTSITFRVEAVVHDEQTGIDNIALLPPGTSNDDLTGDGQITIEDLLVILANWGTCPACCPADLDMDGEVAIGDLLMLLAGW